MLTLSQKISYGICRFGTSLLLNIVTVFTFWAYKDIFAIPAELSGIGNAVGKIAIAFSGFIFGYISDAIDPSKRKLGRRKLFIWIGAPLLALSFVMLFTPHLFISAEHSMMRFIWLMIWNSMFHLFYGFLLTPFQAWMPEITSADERINVSAVQNVANITASLIGAGYTLILAQYYTQTGNLDRRAGILMLVFAILFGVVEVLLFLPALFKIKEKKIPFVKRNLKEEVSVALRNRNYVIYMISFSIMWIGVILITAMILDFINIILGFDTIQKTLIFAVVMFLALAIGLTLWTVIGNKIGKKKSLIIGFAWTMIWMPLTPAIGRIPFIPLIVQGYIFGIGAVIGTSSAFLFGYAIISDFADKDERDTSQNRSGLYTGFKNIPINIGQAAGYIIAGYLAVWKDDLGLTWLGPIAIIFMVIAFPIFLLGNYDPFFKQGNEQEVPIITD
ncbi:MAG: MFS transporter [Candidatus Heimdallarchaeaceae archaeon]|jgi:GPH family glycoside/pentoside/hexuronide:cation symporter